MALIVALSKFFLSFFLIEKPFVIPFKNQIFSIRLRKQVETKLVNMVKLDIIEESNSKYISPAFVVERNNKLRMVIDYRIVNDNTLTEQLPFPSIREILGSFNEAKFYSNIDLNSEYHQIVLETESRQYTSIFNYE